MPWRESCDEAAAQHTVAMIENQRLTGAQCGLRVLEFDEECARRLPPHLAGNGRRGIPVLDIGTPREDSGHAPASQLTV